MLEGERRGVPGATGNKGGGDGLSVIRRGCSQNWAEGSVAY